MRSFTVTIRSASHLLPIFFILSTSYAAVSSDLPSTAQVSSTRISAFTAQLTPPPSETQVLPWQPRLSTTFIPPISCTGSLTMLEAMSWEIWKNEPVPANNQTSSDCYPPAFMTSFLQSIHGNTLPAFSPLVCPQAWETVYSGGADYPCSWNTATACWYIACCPSNYTLHISSTPIPTRFAFGGTCFSEFLSTVVRVHDQRTFVSDRTVTATASDRPVLAFAHPIDGFALNPPSVGTDPNDGQNLNQIIPGAIAGVYGAICVGGLLFWIRKLAKRRSKRELERMRNRVHRPSSPDVYEGVTAVSARSGTERAAMDVEDWRHGVHRELDSHSRRNISS